MLFKRVILLLSLIISLKIYPCNDINRSLYLDLMKKCLINSIYKDSSCSWLDSNKSKYQQKIREFGLDWPSFAHTMIGLNRLNNLQFCVEDVLKNNIPGDLIETGVWRGGATIFMRSILKAYNDTERKVFVADSFEGLPIPNSELYPADKDYDLTKFEILAVSLEEVKSNFESYDLLDDQVVFLKGWFCDTLPKAPIKKLAILRLDGDLYESTMDALINLYPKLSIGGYVIVDDYHIPCCAQAINDFRSKFNISDEFMKIDNEGAIFWKRTK